MRFNVSVAQLLSGLNQISVTHQQMFVHRNLVFVLFAKTVNDNDNTFFLDALTKFDGSRNARQNSGIFKRTRFEKFTNTRKTRGNIHRFSAFFQNLRQKTTFFDFIAVLYIQISASRQVILTEKFSVVTDNQQFRFNIFVNISDFVFDISGVVVDFLFQSRTGNNPFKFYRSRLFGNNRFREGVKCRNRVTGFDNVAFFCQ